MRAKGEASEALTVAESAIGWSAATSGTGAAVHWSGSESEDTERPTSESESVRAVSEVVISHSPALDSERHSSALSTMGALGAAGLCGAPGGGGWAGGPRMVAKGAENGEDLACGGSGALLSSAESEARPAAIRASFRSSLHRRIRSQKSAAPHLSSMGLSDAAASRARD